jgi:hypothetical protein
MFNEKSRNVPRETLKEVLPIKGFEVKNEQGYMGINQIKRKNC